MLDGGVEIVLANWLNKTSTKCTINNYILIKLPDYSYVVVNRTIFCNCELEAEESFLLDSSAACTDNLVSCKMYVTLKLGFISYFHNWMDFNLPPINIDIMKKSRHCH